MLSKASGYFRCFGKQGAPVWADAPLNRFVLLHSICSQHPECRAVTERLTAYQPHRILTSAVVLTEPPSLAATVLSRSACDWAEVSLSLLPVIALWPELPVSIPKERGAWCWPWLVVVTCLSSRTAARMYSVKVYSVFKVLFSEEPYLPLTYLPFEACFEPCF
jgi:hypothetical protein